VGGLKFPKVMFFDGQGFAVTKKSKANKIADLNNATICTAQGSTSELIVADYFRAHKLKYKIVTFASQEQAWDAFVGKRCDAAINDRSGLAARLAKLPTAMTSRCWPKRCPTSDRADRGPGPAALGGGGPLRPERAGGREESGVTQANVDEQKTSQSPDVQRLLGTTGDFGAKLGWPTTMPTRRSRQWATTARSGTATSARRHRCAWSAAATRWSPTRPDDVGSGALIAQAAGARRAGARSRP